MSDIDPDLLRRCREGDQAAWRDLVSEHGRKVFNLAYQFVGRVDEAEDVTQEIFVKVYRSLRSLPAFEGSFPRLADDGGAHHAIDRYRRRRDERLHVADGPAALLRVPAQDEGP